MKKLLCALMIVTFAMTGCTGISTQNSATDNDSHDDEDTTALSETDDNSTTSDSSTTVSDSEDADTPATTFEYYVFDIETLKNVLQMASEESLDKLITKSYPQEELLKAIYFGGTDNMNSTLDGLHKRYPMEAIRVFDDGSLTYCVYKLNEGGFLYVFFHEYTNFEGSPLFTNYVFVVKNPLYRSSFSSIKAGSTLSDVEKIDAGRESFNELNKWGFLARGETYHMVEGGFMRIKYKVPDGTGSWEKYNPDEFIVETVEFVENGSDLISPPDKSRVYDLPDVDYFKYTLLEGDYPK